MSTSLNMTESESCNRECTNILHDFLVTVKAATHECVIRTGQP